MAKKTAVKDKMMMPEMARAMGMPDRAPMMGGKAPMHKMAGGKMMPGAYHKGPMMKGKKGK